MRLNAFLAKAGVGSRRSADELIKAGRVTVNGRLGQLNTSVSESDQVALDGLPVRLHTNRYVLLNKPAGYITTLRDPAGRPKVVDIIGAEERLVPVGRLDVNTTGALLLTNDGELAHRLMHPSFGVEKTYEIGVEGEVTEEVLDKLSNGVKLDDGMTAEARARLIRPHLIELIIHEGRNRQVRRMTSAVGLKLTSLHRSKYGPLGLTGLASGGWRELSPKEIESLKDATMSGNE